MLGLVMATACVPPSDGPVPGGFLSDGAVSGGAVAGDARPVTIDRLIDGDSMELFVDGDPTEVRLLGINAPEMETVGGVESCNGREARRALDDLLATGPLRLESFDTDRFGRLLGRLHAGEVEVNLGEERVEIANLGPAPVDLDGWSIADETTSNRFLLPALTLEPGSRLMVRTGPGPTTATEFHLGRDFPVWNNRGETVLLVDPEGRIADHRFVD